MQPPTLLRGMRVCHVDHPFNSPVPLPASPLKAELVVLGGAFFVSGNVNPAVGAGLQGTGEGLGGRRAGGGSRCDAATAAGGSLTPCVSPDANR